MATRRVQNPTKSSEDAMPAVEQDETSAAADAPVSNGFLSEADGLFFPKTQRGKQDTSDADAKVYAAVARLQDAPGSFVVESMTAALTRDGNVIGEDSDEGKKILNQRASALRNAAGRAGYSFNWRTIPVSMRDEYSRKSGVANATHAWQLSKKEEKKAEASATADATETTES